MSGNLAVSTINGVDISVSPVLNDTQLRSRLNATGTAPIYACRAWVNFNGTGTVAIRASGNVSSITDNGVGDYTVNFTTAMPDANYSGACSASGPYMVSGRLAANLNIFTTTSIKVDVVGTNGASSTTTFFLLDSADILISIFG